MGSLFAQIVNGISVGSIYALVVTGFNLLLLVAGVVQFAYPHVVVGSMYAAWLVLEVTDGSIWIAVPAALLFGIALSALTEPLFRPLARRRAINQTFVMSLALALIFTSLMTRVNNGVPISFPQSMGGGSVLFSFGSATITAGQLYTIVGSLVVVAAFVYLLRRTSLGRAFRAIAQDPAVARLLGIRAVPTALASYAIAGFLAGLSALFLGAAIGSAGPTMGDALGLKASAVALFAGLGNLKGGLICGFVLGLAESLAIGYLPGQWSNAIAFGLILVAVMVRPQGVFGTRV